MIPAPHGGRLVSTQLSRRASERVLAELRDLPKLWPERGQLMDAEMIGTGAYSPLEGYMGREALDTVLRTSRLPNSLPWTIPVLLSPPGSRDRRTVELLRPGDDVALLDSSDRPIALLHLREKFPVERARLAREVYRTTDPVHPNVADLQRTGDTNLAGPIDLIERLESPVKGFEFTPTQSRSLFATRHWATVAGFQTRNVPHRAHEHLQRLTLEREDVDGLFIQPVVGQSKAGDYRPSVVLSTYERLIENYLPSERVILGALPIAMRFAGPRAALFLAIVRKNFGCSHYIVGRDQAGVGRFYDPYDCHRIFDELPVGVVPVRYQESFYCRRCDGMASLRSCPHPEGYRVITSQTRVRKAIVEHEVPPEEILRPEVASILKRSEGLFVGPEEDSGSPGVAPSPSSPAPFPEAEPPPAGDREEVVRFPKAVRAAPLVRSS
ncbi:MAG TPA: sulfate adenylyltransferase [Thermoplasmata archaeon]|nr:sulfate adenylyltransferase [Thermoplasmata archaeon]